MKRNRIRILRDVQFKTRLQEFAELIPLVARRTHTDNRRFRILLPQNRRHRTENNVHVLLRRNRASGFIGNFVLHHPFSRMRDDCADIAFQNRAIRKNIVAFRTVVTAPVACALLQLRVRSALQQPVRINLLRPRVVFNNEFVAAQDREWSNPRLLIQLQSRIEIKIIEFSRLRLQKHPVDPHSRECADQAAAGKRKQMQLFTHGRVGRHVSRSFSFPPFELRRIVHAETVVFRVKTQRLYLPDHSVVTGEEADRRILRFNPERTEPVHGQIEHNLFHAAGRHTERTLQYGPAHAGIVIDRNQFQSFLPLFPARIPQGRNTHCAFTVKEDARSGPEPDLHAMKRRIFFR